MPADQKGRGEQEAAHSSLPRGRAQQLSLLTNHFAIQARQQRLKFFSLTLASFNEPRYRKVALEQDSLGLFPHTSQSSTDTAA